MGDTATLNILRRRFFIKFKNSKMMLFTSQVQSRDENEEPPKKKGKITMPKKKLSLKQPLKPENK